MKKIAKYASFLGIAGLLLALATGCDSYKEDEDFGEAALVAEQNEAVRAVTESDTWKSAEFFVVAKCGAGGFKFPVMYTADEADITAVSLKVISSKKINVLQPFLNEGWKQGTDAIDTEAGKWVTVTSSDSAAHKGAGVQILDSAAEGIYVFGIKDFKVTTSSGTKTITASDLDKNCDLSWGGNNVYAKIQKNENKVVDENEQAMNELEERINELEKKLGENKADDALANAKKQFSDAVFFYAPKEKTSPDFFFKPSNASNVTSYSVTLAVSKEVEGAKFKAVAKLGTDWTWTDQTTLTAGANDTQLTTTWQTFTVTVSDSTNVQGVGGQIYDFEDGVIIAIKDVKITVGGTEEAVTALDKLVDSDGFSLAAN